MSATAETPKEHCTWARTEAGRPECLNEREVKIILHGRYVAALFAQHTAEIVPMLVKKYKTVQTWPYKEKPKTEDKKDERDDTGNTKESSEV